MKKNVILVIAACLLTFAAGFVIGSKSQSANSDTLDGDINRINRYGLVINDPSEHAEVLKARLNEFLTITSWVSHQDSYTSPSLSEAVKQMQKLQKKTLKAMNDPKKAFELLTSQEKAGKAFVNAADEFIRENPDSRLTLGSIRDLVASFCYQNAMLTANDAEIDFWSNAPSMVEANEMTYSIDE